jgi:hypothetical protein
MWRTETYSKMTLNTVNVIFFTHMLIRPEIEMQLRIENFRTLSGPALFQASSSILSADTFHNRWNGWRGPTAPPSHRSHSAGLSYTGTREKYCLHHEKSCDVYGRVAAAATYRLERSGDGRAPAMLTVAADSDPSHVLNTVATFQFNSKRWYLLSGHLPTDLTVWSL